MNSAAIHSSQGVELPYLLSTDAAWSRVVEAGAAVRLIHGSAWVTFEGDPEDHVIQAPAEFEVPRRGRIAVLALEPLSFRVGAAGPELAS